MSNKLYQMLVNLFIGCYLVAMLLVFLSNSNAVSALQIELAAIILAVVILFRGKIPHFSVLLFLFAFAVRLTACWFYNTVVPVSDFKTMFEAAQHTIRGDFTYNQDVYFSTWAYQTGFVLFEAMFLKLYNSIWTLKIVNCLIGAGTAVLVYKISQILWEDESVAQIVSLVYSVFAFHVVHAAVLTNSHACAFFSFWGIYLLLKGSSMVKSTGLKWNILAGICIACGNIIRPEGITFLVPIIVLYIFKMFAAGNKETMFRCIKQVGVLMIAYFLVVNVVAGSIKLTGINPNGLSNQDPLWKFVLGTNYESGGSWNDADSSLVSERQEEYGGDRTKAEWSIIKERIAEQRQLVDLALMKLDTFWWSLGGIYWTVDHTIWPKLCETIRTFQVSEFWVVFCFSLLALFQIKGMAGSKRELLLIPFIIFVNFFVYLMIETQVRYAYLNQISVFVLAGGGLVFVKSKFQQLRVKINGQGGV